MQTINELWFFIPSYNLANTWNSACPRSDLRYMYMRSRTKGNAGSLVLNDNNYIILKFVILVKLSWHFVLAGNHQPIVN